MKKHGSSGSSRTLLFVARCQSILAIVLVSMLAFGLAGCTQNAKQPSAGGETTKGAGDVKTLEYPDLPTGKGDKKILAITGPGIKYEMQLSLSQLQEMKDGYLKETFSARNNWPTDRTFTAEGISIPYLLKVAGINDKATTITFKSDDGYLANFTRDQLLGTRYRYPKLKESSKEGAAKVTALLAWNSTGDSESAQKGLRDFVGQACLTDVNTVVSVKNVTSIEVKTSPPGTWEQPQYDVTTSGNEKEITLYHDTLDSVKIYYTTDGSDPTIDSKLYNPSTTYYQPELIVPIKAAAGTTFKCIVVGYGKNPSDILSVQM